MFTKSAKFYDAIYSWKDYATEAAKLREFIATHNRSDGNALLDVACGTGQHVTHLKTAFRVEGLDLDAELLTIARQRHPELTFHRADMTDFSLGKQFDVVTCLFSSIGYARTVDKLNKAIQAMSDHLLTGGVLIVEPWFSTDQFHSGTVHSLLVNEPALRIARMNVSRIEDGVSVLDFHYLVAEPDGVRYFTERHDMGLFSADDYLRAFRQAGLDVTHDIDGLDGRGLYVGVKP